LKTSVIRPSRLSYVAFALTLLLAVNAALASPPQHRRSKSDRNLDAIGRRKLVKDWNFYTPTKETDLGEKITAAYEQQVVLLLDPATANYIDSLAARLARNSDATIPISIRVLSRRDVEAFTTYGGRQYITWGLLSRLQNEGELASVLARGIAHTALHSAAREVTRQAMLQMALAPLEPSRQSGRAYIAAASQIGMLDWYRTDELDADYFGIQYLYKTGYDTDCFLSAIQRVWPDSSNPNQLALSPFPPVTERMKLLQHEIDQILPKRFGALVSTPEFEEFLRRLRNTEPPDEPIPDTQPKLIRHDLAGTTPARPL
jgi:predicted Zn-dependent protease